MIDSPYEEFEMKRFIVFLILNIFNLNLYAATCAGIDDTQFVKDLISQNAGKIAQLPEGTCVIHEAIYIPANTTLAGSLVGITTLVQAANAPGSQRLLYTNGDNVTIRNLVLDGNRSQQTVDQWRHGIFVQNANTVIHQVRSHHFTGDGFYLYNNAVNTSITYSRAHDNARHGLAITGGVGSRINQSQFYDNDIFQIDIEPGITQKVKDIIMDKIVVGGAGQRSTGIGVSMSGRPLSEPGLIGEKLTLTNSLIYGPVQATYTQGTIIRGNVIVNSTNKSALTIYRDNINAIVENNTITQLQNTKAWPFAVEVSGTQGTSSSNGTVIKNNRIFQNNPNGEGIRAQGISNVKITNNFVQGAGVASPLRSGIAIRATVISRPIDLVTITGNTIKDFGASGVGIFGNLTATITALTMQNNKFENSTASGPQKTGASLDDGTHALQSIVCGGNIAGLGVATPVINLPAGLNCNF